MKKLKNYWPLLSLLLLGVLALFVQGCKKGDEPQVPEEPGIEQVTVSGSITLPSGSPRDVNGLSILSPIAAGTVSGGQYQVATIKEEFTTQIAANAAGEPVLMGYCYPGQTDFAINAQSTVLAMLMNAGAVYSLTPEGKQQLITKIKADPAFAAAVQEVERRLLTPSTALLDITDQVLGGRVAALFTNVSRRVQFGPAQAVRIDRAGRNLTFTNAGVPFCNTVGIYKDGQQVKQLDLAGQNFFATSLAELLTGDISIGGSATPATAAYTLPGDGQFDIRIRSGKFGAGANGPEQLAAFSNNLMQGSLIILTGALPQLKANNSCRRAVVLALLNRASTYQTVAGVSTAAGIVVATKEIALGVINDGVTLNNACSGGAFVFGSRIENLITFLSRLSAIGSAMNLTALGVSWVRYPAAQDTCFTAQGMNVGACGGSTRSGTMSWTMDGATITASTVISNDNNVEPRGSGIYVQGAGLYLHFPKAVGTYPLRMNTTRTIPTALGRYSTTAYIYGAGDDSAGTGTITVTTLTASRMIGTFSGTFARDAVLTAGTSKVITNGNFTMNF